MRAVRDFAIVLPQFGKLNCVRRKLMLFVATFKGFFDEVAIQRQASDGSTALTSFLVINMRSIRQSDMRGIPCDHQLWFLPCRTKTRHLPDADYATKS